MNTRNLSPNLNYSLDQAEAAKQMKRGFPLNRKQKRILTTRAVLDHQFNKDYKNRLSHPFDNLAIKSQTSIPSVDLTEEEIENYFILVEEILTEELLLTIQIESLDSALKEIDTLLNDKTIEGSGVFAEHDFALLPTENQELFIKREKIRQNLLEADKERLVFELTLCNKDLNKKNNLVLQYITSILQLIDSWKSRHNDTNQTYTISLSRLDVSHFSFKNIDLRLVDFRGCNVTSTDFSGSRINPQQLINSPGFSTIIYDETSQIAKISRTRRYLQLEKQLLEKYTFKGKSTEDCLEILSKDHLSFSFVSCCHYLKYKQLQENLNEVLATTKACFSGLDVLQYFDYLLLAPSYWHRIPDTLLPRWAHMVLTSDILNKFEPTRSLSNLSIAMVSLEQFFRLSRSELEEKVASVLAHPKLKLNAKKVALAKCSKLGKLSVEWHEGLPQAIGDIKRWMPDLSDEAKRHLMSGIEMFKILQQQLKTREVLLRDEFDQLYINCLIAELADSTSSHAKRKNLIYALTTAAANPALVVDASAINLTNVDLKTINLTNARLRLNQQQMNLLSKEQKEERYQRFIQAIVTDDVSLAHDLFQDGININVSTKSSHTAIKKAELNYHRQKLINLMTLVQHTKNFYPTLSLAIYQMIARQVKNNYEIEIVDLSHFPELTDDLFYQILLNVKTIKEINISFCVNLTNVSLQHLAKHCPSLEKLTAEGLTITQFLNSYNECLKFPNLRILSLNKCKQLVTLKIDAPKLIKFESNECSKLQVVKINKKNVQPNVTLKRKLYSQYNVWPSWRGQRPPHDINWHESIEYKSIDFITQPLIIKIYK